MNRLPYRVVVKAGTGETQGFKIKTPSFLSHYKYIKIEMLMGSIYTNSSEPYKGDYFLACYDLVYDQIITPDSNYETMSFCWMLSNKYDSESKSYPIYLPNKQEYTFGVIGWGGYIQTVFRGNFIFELTGVDL